MNVLRDLFGPGTWGAGGNIAAAPILAALGTAVTYPLRHKIGRRLAAWWATHHGPHAIEQHKQALREHEEERGGTGARLRARPVPG